MLTRLTLLVFTLCLFPVAALAADAKATIPITVWTPVIAVLVPILLLYIKKAIPPSATLAILGLAPVLGAVVEWLIAWFNGQAADPKAGAVYGALGVFLREIVDQIRRAPWTPDAWTPPGA